MPLFEVAILEQPTKEESENGQLERLVFGPSFVIAKDSQDAAIITFMDNKDISVDRARMKVLSRPF